MNMQELKQLIYKGEKVDIECKEAESNMLRADYKMRLIYVGENPYKGTFKRNNEGDYHATEHEIRGMIRDQNTDGNDGMIL